MTIPPHTLAFSLPTVGDNEGFNWTRLEEQLIKDLQANEGHQKELRRTLFANSFKFGDQMMCSFEAIYSIARLLFTFVPNLSHEDWPLVNTLTRDNPAIILLAIGLDPIEFTQMNQFCFFILEGISTKLAPDIESVIEATNEFNLLFGSSADNPPFNLC